MARATKKLLRVISNRCLDLAIHTDLFTLIWLNIKITDNDPTSPPPFPWSLDKKDCLKHSYHKTIMPFKEVSSILAYTKDSYSNNPHELFQIPIGYTCGFDLNTVLYAPLLKTH